MFWAATLAWDYLNYLIPAFAMLIVFAAFGTNAYVDGHRLGLVLLVLLLYGWAALAFVYLVSFLFRSPATAMVILIVFNIVTGRCQFHRQDLNCSSNFVCLSSVEKFG